LIENNITPTNSKDARNFIGHHEHAGK